MLSLWLSVLRGLLCHSSLSVSCYLCLLLLPVGRSTPWLLSPLTSILVRHGSLDGISQGFLEIATPELWFSRQQKGDPKPKATSDIEGMSRQLSQCPQPGETRAQACTEGWGQEQRLMLPGLEMFPSHLPAHYNLPTEVKSHHRVCAPVWFSVWTGAGRREYLSSIRNCFHRLYDRSQSLLCTYSNFCISKVFSWAGAYLAIQTWFRFFRWWWIHNLTN